MGVEFGGDIGEVWKCKCGMLLQSRNLSHECIGGTCHQAREVEGG